MFFILSKLLSFFLQPLIWVIILITIGLLVSKATLKRRLTIASLVVFLFFSNTFIFSEFTRLWEVEGKTLNEVESYDIGIVLGGMSEYNNDLERLSLRRGGDRIWQAIQLYRAKKIKKILISGANGHLIDKGLLEATQLKTDLIKLGIPAQDILTESVSRNTHENAVETMKIIEKIEVQPSILLITSAIHMKRAQACFKQEGLKNFGVFTTDHYTGSKRGYQVDQFIVPNVGTLANWNSLIKEWIGYLVYDMVGYI